MTGRLGIPIEVPLNPLQHGAAFPPGLWLKTPLLSVSIRGGTVVSFSLRTIRASHEADEIFSRRQSEDAARDIAVDHDPVNSNTVHVHARSESITAGHPGLPCGVQKLETGLPTGVADDGISLA